MRNTGYKQARIAKKVTWPGHLPLDRDGEIIQPIGTSTQKQAVLMLQGEDDPDEYDVMGHFEVGQKIGFIENGVITGNTPTRIYSPEDCIPDMFDADRHNLIYGVSYKGLGFDFNDSMTITSSVDGAYREYTIISYPDWMTVTQGTTAGMMNTLHLFVPRNRTEDNLRTGEIRLIQSGTEKTLTIKVTQLGRLTEKIPTEYPYVTEEEVIDQGPSRVIQIGEQIWTAPLTTIIGHPNVHQVRGCYITEWRNKYTGASVWESLGDTRIQAWLDGYNGKNGVDRFFKDGIIPTGSEINALSGRGYNFSTIGGALIPGIRKFYGEEENGSNEDIYKHHVGMFNDWLELGGFIAAHNWDPDVNEKPWTGNPSSRTLGMKDRLDTSISGYDDVRLATPERWEWWNTLDLGANTNAVLISESPSTFFQPLRNPTANKIVTNIKLSYDNSAGTTDRIIKVYIATYDPGYAKHPTNKYVPDDQSMGAVEIAAYTAIKGTKGIATIELNQVCDSTQTLLIETDSEVPLICTSADIPDTDVGGVYGFDISNGWKPRGNAMAITYGFEHPVIKGTDKYAFGLFHSGTWHPYENNENYQYNIAWIFTRGNRNGLPDEGNWTMRYEKTWRGTGIIKTTGAELVDAVQVRALRYRPLQTYDIYDNGTEIRKIYNTETIPEGFTVLPKGAMRGAWFGNPDLTREQLVLCEAYAIERLSSGGGGIG